MKTKSLKLFLTGALVLIGLATLSSLPVSAQQQTPDEIDVEYTNFILNKTDQNGEPLNGADFEISEITYSVGFEQFYWKSTPALGSIKRNVMEYITEDGLFYGFAYTPSTLSVINDSPNLYYTIVQTYPDIYFKDGTKVNVAEGYNDKKEKYYSFHERFQYQLPLQGYAYTFLDSFDPNYETFMRPYRYMDRELDLERTIKDVYLCPDITDELTCVLDAVDGKNLLPKSQYRIIGEGLREDFTLEITLPITAIKNAKSQEVLRAYSIDTIYKTLGCRNGNQCPDFLTPYADLAGKIIIEETKAPTGYQVSLDSRRIIDTKITKEVTFTNSPASGGTGGHNIGGNGAQQNGASSNGGATSEGGDSGEEDGDKDDNTGEGAKESNTEEEDTGNGSGADKKSSSSTKDDPAVPDTGHNTSTHNQSSLTIIGSIMGGILLSLSSLVIYKAKSTARKFD